MLAFRVLVRAVIINEICLLHVYYCLRMNGVDFCLSVQ